ncbi:MAG: polysaccharide deacetylase family protein [Chitinispirillaceae bacterium]
MEINSLKQKNALLNDTNSQLSQEIENQKLKFTRLRERKEKTPKVKADIPSTPKKKSRRKQTSTIRPRLTSFGLPYTVNNGSENRTLVALTFDGGSHANAATEILDTLASRNVRSTMFFTGHFIKRYPQIVKRVVHEGHELGNHTMSHPRLTTYAQTRTHRTRSDITRRSVIRELIRAEKLLKRVTGHSFSPLWRAPYGEFNWEICSWAQEAGYLHIGWRRGRTWSENLDSNDWIPDIHTPGYKSPEQVMKKFMRMARSGELNGGIVLLHLGTERGKRSQQVHLILGQLIDSLRTTGYEVVTVSRLLQESDIDINTIKQQKLSADRTN